MRQALLLWLCFALPLAACDASAAPEPTFEPVFPGVPGALMSLSSPALADLDGDGAPDIVYGTGIDRLRPPERGIEWAYSDEPEVPGWVTAVSGATNEVLWRAPHTGDAFTTPRFADLDGDGISDVIMGGREAAFAAYSGRDGSVLWRLPPERVAETPAPYGFYTPAVIADADGDGVADLLVTYGGDPTRMGDPQSDRDPGFLAVVSGARGEVLAVHPTPDGAETYASPVVYERADGTPWVVFGTGGETHPGAAFRAPLGSLLDGSFPRRVERLVEPGDKGVMAPATLLEVTGDDEPDVAVSTFDGRLLMVDGASGEVMWAHENGNEESYHPPAVARIARDGRLGLLLSRGVGVFPLYAGTVSRLFDAADGTLLYVHRDSLLPAGAPLAVDLTGDGLEELIHFSDPGRIHVYHAPSQERISHELGANLSGTPLVADPAERGGLELIGVSWRNLSGLRGMPSAEDLRSELLRLDLGSATPGYRSWAGYMGTAADGRHRPPPAETSGAR